MTLIITELSSFGIAMAADSAITTTNSISGLASLHPRAANKLQMIRYLNAGISCWGIGSLNGIGTDAWLSQFINQNSHLKTLADFAVALANELNKLNIPRSIGLNNLGFHLAGFEYYNGQFVPSFFHIHDGPSGIFTNANPNIFNANQDMSPAIYLQNIGAGGYYVTRNGDFQIYATLYTQTEALFQSLATFGIIIPNSKNVRDRADYLVFWIRTVSELYRMSNLHPGIGGRIDYLTILPQGISSAGSQFY